MSIRGFIRAFFLGPTSDVRRATTIEHDQPLSNREAFGWIHGSNLADDPADAASKQRTNTAGPLDAIFTGRWPD